MPLPFTALERLRLRLFPLFLKRVPLCEDHAYFMVLKCLEPIENRHFRRIPVQPTSFLFFHLIWGMAHLVYEAIIFTTSP